MMKHSWQYMGLGFAAVVLGAFGQALAAGQVPIPPAWAWVVPILHAGLIYCAAQLPSLNGEG